MVDVGAGTGLLALAAAERVAPEGDVIALDISVDALEELRAHAAASNMSYLVGSADVLPLPDAHVDGVVTRSVLIYVDDKAEAAREFARVLRPHGRVSLFEPINSRNLRLADALDLSPLGELGERLRAWNEKAYTDTDDPMLNFDAPDLERFFAEAGLEHVHLAIGVDEDELAGERYLNQVGAPGRPRLRDRLETEFGAADAERIATFIAERTVPTRGEHVFLTARKP